LTAWCQRRDPDRVVSPYRANPPLAPSEPFRGLLARVRTRREDRLRDPEPELASAPRWWPSLGSDPAPLPPWIIGGVVALCGAPLMTALGYIARL
jgi:hypothetical protein